MRIYYFFAALILFISSFSVSHASTLIDSDIAVDTVWNKSGSPYIISSSISVVPEATLTITPGTIIKFDGGEIIVEGKLVAEGTPYENIQFTSIYNDDENEPSPYDYGGIIFLNATATSSLAHTVFSYVGNGIEVVASPLSLTHVTVSNSGDGITANNSSIISDNLTIDTIDASAVTGFNSSSLAFTATTIKNVQGNALYIFGSTTPLKIDFDGNGTIDSTITPSQDPDPLMYLEALKKFVDTLAIPQVQKNNLLKKIDKIITQIKNGKLKKAQITIKQYLKKYHDNKKFKKKLTPEEIQQMIQILTNLINTLSP